MSYRALICVAVAAILAGCNSKHGSDAADPSPTQAPSATQKQQAMASYASGFAQTKRVRSIEEIEAETAGKNAKKGN